MRRLGIDHPLILVRDIATARALYGSLGFNMTPPSRHPWGTSTTAAIFRNCLLEIMGVYDETLIDRLPAGDFRFGRFIRDHLVAREGISLLALNTDDAAGDEAAVAGRGVTCQGTIEFGRDVVLPDGRADRTATTLKILHAPGLPRLSNFACQQHRRDLIEPAPWLSHPNGATGISDVTILAEVRDHARVRERLAGLYGEEAIFRTPGSFGAHTGNGDFVVIDRAAAAETFGTLPPEVDADPEPSYVAVDVRVPNVAAVRSFVEAAGLAHRQDGGSLLLTDARRLGNVFLRFVADPDSRP